MIVIVFCEICDCEMYSSEICYCEMYFFIVKGILVIVMTGVEIYYCDCDVIF